jgi:hypothetical protein
MNNNLFEIGDTRITYYQKFIIIVGVILLILFTLLSLDNNYPFIIVLTFSIIIFLYSKVYSIKYNSEYFYVKNLFKKEVLSATQFVKIRKVKFIDFLLIAVFQEKSFLLMIKSEDIIKNFFKSRSKYAEELTQTIKKNVTIN